MEFYIVTFYITVYIRCLSKCIMRGYYIISFWIFMSLRSIIQHCHLIYYTSKVRKCDQNSIAKITGENLFVFLPCNVIQYKNQYMAHPLQGAHFERLYNEAQTKHISYRSNCAENSGSHLNSDDKQLKAESVVRWETARESSGDDGFSFFHARFTTNIQLFCDSLRLR